ncbi:MAG TPA: helix-turn-helix domain-containing protein [Chitinophagaceae bacterium]|nr:helix-turn-helix domain-containing protein [Chitinophagaceae bacterium]
MDITFQLFPVLPRLKGFIEIIWLFESAAKLPDNDLKLIVPNGRPLLLVTHKNGASAMMGGRQFTAAENKISIVGICDNPSIVDSLTNGPTSSIGMEFSPWGFYRFFNISPGELKNDLNFLADISGKEAAAMESSISGMTSPREKVDRIQLYLLSMLVKKPEDALFYYCIRQIEETKGDISISRLQEITGYSSRWLNLKFKEKLGISPKNFGSIIRFQHYYKSIILDAPTLKIRRPYYHHYYDQSHFIKDFKRFTGMTPSKLLDIENRFGRLFY